MLRNVARDAAGMALAASWLQQQPWPALQARFGSKYAPHHQPAACHGHRGWLLSNASSKGLRECAWVRWGAHNVFACHARIGAFW